MATILSRRWRHDSRSSFWNTWWVQVPRLFHVGNGTTGDGDWRGWHFWSCGARHGGARATGFWCVTGYKKERGEDYAHGIATISATQRGCYLADQLRTKACLTDNSSKRVKLFLEERGEEVKRSNQGSWSVKMNFGHTTEELKLTVSEFVLMKISEG